VTGCRLYLITPPQIDLDPFAAAFEQALSGGDVACLQIRLKDVPEAEIVRAAQTLIPMAHKAGVSVLINDRPDLAKASGADGVHVGQEDASYAEARRIVGPKNVVGVTCHDSRHLAMEAGDAGADYVAFGAFFETTTKSAKYKADVDVLTWWSDIFEIPCVAIGGITVDNAQPLIAAGADFLAVSAGVWHHPQGPAAAVRGFNALFSTK
jgi:thiamine-phosphate pyrophosphorylase